MKKKLFYLIPFLFLLACDHGSNQTIHHNIEVLEKILENPSQEKEISVSIQNDFVEEGFSPVVIFGEQQDYYTTKRTDKIAYPCAECHADMPTDSLEDKRNHTSKMQKAHWNIHLQHASPESMDCLTCHHSEDKNYLTSLKGSKIPFDASYQLCAQCHNSPFEDWQGGAHGKRLIGWAKPRVIQNCVECHNPHNPSIPKRWPSRLVKPNNQ